MLVVLSALLTSGAATVRADIDDPGSSLVVNHAYCSQDIADMFITGRATSNVHDAGADVSGELGLRGVAVRSRVGLLLLFEWHDLVRVGDNLKSPLLPVWVVCSESHYSVLFQSCGQGCDDLPLMLHYYDGLARQATPISLLLTRGSEQNALLASRGGGASAATADLPPLECVIHTRWPAAAVDWNGTEPILQVHALPPCRHDFPPNTRTRFTASLRPNLAVLCVASVMPARS